MSAAGVTAAERSVDDLVEIPSLVHLSLICPHLLGLRETRFRKRCRGREAVFGVRSETHYMRDHASC